MAIDEKTARKHTAELLEYIPVRVEEVFPENLDGDQLTVRIEQLITDVVEDARSSLTIATHPPSTSSRNDRLKAVKKACRGFLEAAMILKGCRPNTGGPVGPFNGGINPHPPPNPGPGPSPAGVDQKAATPARGKPKAAKARGKASRAAAKTKGRIRRK